MSYGNNTVGQGFGQALSITVNFLYAKALLMNRSYADPEKRISSVLTLYLRLDPMAFFTRLFLRSKRRYNCGIFTLPVVIWLMIFQRLHDKGTLSAAVQQAVYGLPSALNPRPGKRLREGNVSGNTGGYNQARKKLPLEVVQKVNDEIFEKLQTASKIDGQIYILDGTMLLMPRTPELLEAYPPSRNQTGESHWPVIRVLVAHNLHSGLALRPASGPKMISEQQLTQKLLTWMPSGAAVMGDQNFGVFSVAWAAQRLGHPVLLRLTPSRAKRVFGSTIPGRADLKINWEPSKNDRASLVDLPADVHVQGRLIVRKVYPSDGSGSVRLYLFTTMQSPVDEIIQLYGLRWNVETDLRTIKKTIRLEMLSCQTPEMVAKELILAITAYNLVRAIIEETADRAQMDPRQYSFSRVQDLVNGWLPRIASLSSDAERQAEYERMLKYVAQCKLYKRKITSSYPRAVWYRRRTFPPHKNFSSQRLNPNKSNEKGE
jgi:putative transposase